MGQERAAKQTIRNIWLEEIKRFNDSYTDDDVPLYLTLSGAEARDIKLLVDHKLIELTENGSIASGSAKRVVAIERSRLAVLSLQRLFPGLKIVEQEFANLLVGNSLLRYPTGAHEKLCCARIVNLDFQDSLTVTEDNGNINFPTLIWIQKLAQIHASSKPGQEWCLCLTLNSSITWTQSIATGIQQFLQDNFKRSAEFEASCRQHFGDTLHQSINSDQPFDAQALSLEDKQRLLMVFVPKKIASLVYLQNWQVKTSRNLRYGGARNEAPMVTWVFSFVWDPRASLAPDVVYKDCLDLIFSATGYVSDTGEIDVSWTQ